MDIIVTENAVRSFQDEWGIENGQYVRIYAKYAGGGEDAYAIGINASVEPVDPAIVKSIGGYLFFIEHNDAWILKDKTIKIDSNEEGIFFGDMLSL
ncbi:HesB/YadR/YfhF family protein [Paenibacillus faecalis]|uniref:HesB/YadR/YfhF family protein n=1 Tax=Paenibacillus faecalis TaxID=2079532 RepID=UPI000D0ECA17|nr:Fe-S cluster assembly protein HesB [Paenibacillus faecalis]